MSALIKALLVAMPVAGIAAVLGAGDQITDAIDAGMGRQKDNVQRMRDNVHEEMERVKARKAEWYLLTVPSDLDVPAGPKRSVLGNVDFMDFMMQHKDIDPYESALQDYEHAITNPQLLKVRGVKVSEKYQAMKEQQAKEVMARYRRERSELYNKLLREGKVTPPTL